MRKVNEIRIGDRLYSRWFLEQDSGQRALAYAHREKIEVVCLCNNIPMHVAHAKNYFLRRNPGTGSLHATSCPSFTQDDIEVGPAHTVKHQAVERDNGTIKILPGFPVPHFAGITPPSSSPDGLTLVDLLRLLWREAGLNIWRDTAAVRDWEFVREKLDTAAGRVMLRGNGGMGRFILIPRPFDANKVDELTQERDVWLTKFRMPATGGVFIVAGILKSHSQTRNNNTSIQIKHMAEKQIICATDIAAQIEAATIGGACSVFVLASVRCSGQYLIGDKVALLSVTRKEMLPVAHKADLLLTELLVERGRHFIKPISINGGELDGAFLTDCAGGKRIGFKGAAPAGAISVSIDLLGLELPAVSAISHK